MANIFNRVNKANDKAGLLEYRLGDPYRKPLLFQYYGINEAKLRVLVSSLLISPPPKITSPPRRLIDLVVGSENSGITVSSMDKVAQISRSYPYETFVRSDKNRAICYIDPPLINGVVDPQAIKLDKYRVLYVEDLNCCFWNVILRLEKDK